MIAAIRRWFGNLAEKEVQRKERGRRLQNQLERSYARASCCMVVDDDEHTRDQIARIVESVGGTVVGVRSADECVKAFEEYSPELIFIEVALHQSDAIEVIRGLAERKYTGPVQLLSDVDQGLMSEIHAIGTKYRLNMLPVIGKPLPVHVLQDLVRNHLSRRSRGEAEKPVGPVVDLDVALQRGWLEPWYQPKIDLQQRKMVGVEALVRLNHPDHGIIPPSNFLPQAQTQALHRLTEFMIVAGLRDWTRLREAGFPVKVAVNASVDCLMNTPIAKLVRENRPKHLDWPGLILEVTEEQVIKNLSLFHEIATQLNIYDVSFSVDDFGSGYSSFQRLKQFAFCELKLDGSFVQGCSYDEHNAAICQAVIDLAHSYGASAVAECVDDRDDLLAVHQMGCDIAQGYLLCRPVPIQKLVSMLKLKANEQRRPTVEAHSAPERTPATLQVQTI